MAINAGTDLVAWADERRFRTACTCLLAVAVAHAGPGSTVRAQAERSGKNTRITVAMPTATIPAAIAALIAGCVPLDQSGDPWSAAAFRCWLARRLVEAHGGSLVLDSDGADARFTMTVPD